MGYSSQHRPLRRAYYRNASRFQQDDDLRYEYKRDYPLNLQSNDPKKDGVSKFTIVFSFSDKERTAIEKIMGKKLTGNLLLTFEAGNHGSTTLRMRDEGSQKNGFPHHDKVVIFVRDNIEDTYIEAIRDSLKTTNFVEEMVSEQISVLETKTKYRTLLQKLEKMQRPILDELSKDLTKSVSEFLPEVKNIHLDSKERIRRIGRVGTTLHINDGTDTPLEQKGDGIKSLVVISILQYAAKQRARKKKIFLAIEEPESHLHPDTIHKLRKVLEEISTKNQVIISTHSPLLVNRNDMSRNIIVDQSKALPATNIA